MKSQDIFFSILGNRRLWFWLMVALMVVIFLLSCQDYNTSHAFSNAVAEAAEIEAKEAWEEPSGVAVLFNLNLRKLAHIVEYGALGFTAWMYVLSAWKSFAVCFAYACFDEIHQYFVPGRSASVSDILIDSVGIVLAIAGCEFIFWLWKSGRLKRMYIVVSGKLKSRNNRK